MENYINKLDLNTNKLLETVKGIPNEKLNARSDGEWTILEILEHIYNSDKVIYGLLKTPSETN